MADIEKVPGTAYEAHQIGARDYIEIMSTVDDPLLRMIHIAYYCTHEKGARVWADVDACGAAPWPLVKKCAEAALVANDMLEADAAGN